jgi:hypothetical protein
VVGKAFKKRRVGSSDWIHVLIVLVLGWAFCLFLLETLNTIGVCFFILRLEVSYSGSAQVVFWALRLLPTERAIRFEIWGKRFGILAGVGCSEASRKLDIACL